MLNILTGESKNNVCVCVGWVETLNKLDLIWPSKNKEQDPHRGHFEHLLFFSLYHILFFGFFGVKLSDITCSDLSGPYLLWTPTFQFLLKF